MQSLLIMKKPQQTSFSDVYLIWCFGVHEYENVALIRCLLYDKHIDARNINYALLIMMTH